MRRATTSIHGGSLWQPHVRRVEDYSHIVAADVNDAWYPPAPQVLKSIAQWSKYSNHSPDTSCTSLIEALSRRFSIDRSAIRIGAGASDLLHAFIQSVLSSGDEVLVLDPTYGEYARAAALAGASVKRIPLDPSNGFEVDPRQILSRITKRTRLVALCNPNNPTGRVLPRRRLLDLIKAIPSRTFLLIDEAYIDFIPGETLVADVPNFPNLAVIRTFSKAFALAGLRVGFAALGESARKRFNRIGGPPWPVNLVGLKAAETALETYPYVERRVSQCNRIKSKLVSTLVVPCLPSDAHYFLLDLHGFCLSPSQLLEALRAQCIFLRGLNGFTRRYNQRFVRLTVQDPPTSFRIASQINSLI